MCVVGLKPLGCQLLPPGAPVGSTGIVFALTVLYGVKIGAGMAFGGFLPFGVAASTAFCVEAAPLSAAVTVRSENGGMVGIGCVGDVFCSVLCGTGRSGIGKIGLPVSRSTK